MELGVVLEMAQSAAPHRVAAVGPDGRELTVAELARGARRFAGELVATGVDRVGYLAGSDPALAVALFGAALAGIAFCPFNYRLADDQLRTQLEAEANSLLVAGARELPRLEGLGFTEVIGLDQLRANVDASDTLDARDDEGLPAVDDDAVAVQLYTSGTTSNPKAAILRHRHLTSYLLSSVEFAGASEDDAVLVSVPPYHIAGIATILSNLFALRRIVYLDPFDPQRWLEVAAKQRVTHAMVVPTMLARIVDTLHGEPADVPSLRSLAFGGSPMPPSVVEAALVAFDGVDLVNAYGLTETSSTITVLDGDDHRAAFASSDPDVRARLGSVGRAVPGIELEVRNDDGTLCAPGDVGAVFVRGDQVSGEYLDAHTGADAWFATRDLGRLDAEGYLFIEGRSDDTIIRGGENIAPAEIEHVLLRRPEVADCAVVGIPDVQWGHRIAAFVVATGGCEIDPDEVREWVRSQLRSAKTPDVIEIRDELPRTDTGKVLRRQLQAGYIASTEANGSP